MMDHERWTTTEELITAALFAGATPIDTMPDPLALPVGSYVARSQVTVKAAGMPDQRINMLAGDRLTIKDERRELWCREGVEHDFQPKGVHR
jgi:hypothetical protein